MALERYVPPYRYSQAEVVPWIRRWLEPLEPRVRARLLAIYDTAGVKRRGSVVPIEEAFETTDFERKNERYGIAMREAGIATARRALQTAALPAQDVGLVVSASCTGFMIPAVDAYVANALGLGPRLCRLPITESGCAGGIVGLARALDFLVAHPDQAALVLALEFASLTFQAWDLSPANVVSTAIFGDGGAAVLLVGGEHPRASDARVGLLGSSSVFLPDTTHLMGFELRNQGLQIVLDKSLTRVVKNTVRRTVDEFLAQQQITRAQVAHWILHPGGRRVIDVMAEELALPEGALGATADVLAEHGNMSSVTVLFVLDELLRSGAARPGDLGLMAAFGPGFGAELLLTEFA